MIEVENISVKLSDFCLKDISFSVGAGEIFALLGPTGSGKSVILEAMMGLIPLRSGNIRIAGSDVSNLPPESRDLGLVYQDQALFPHMSVQENILYGVKYHYIPEETRKSRFDMLVENLRLKHILHRNPTTLSGGEKQRVALARSLMLKPRALLLDEPLAALDPEFRDEIRQLLKSLHSELSIPFILVSHDFSEVHFLASRGVILKNGSIQQSGNIEDLFERPNSSFVASFAGMKNIFPCRLDKSSVHIGELTLKRNSDSSPEDTHLAIRPEEIYLVVSREMRSLYPNILSGIIEEMDSHGFYFRVAIRTGDCKLQAYWTRQLINENNIQPGQEVEIAFSARSLHTFREPGA